MSSFNLAGENAFEDKQQSYYLQQLNRALPVRGGYDYKARIAQNDGKSSLATMNTALATIDPMMPPDTTQVSGVQSFFSTFDRQAKLESVDAQCRAFKTPDAQNMRAADSRTGCGWWYSDDPNTQSVSAHGTRRGPMNPTLQQGGEWIWDLEEAYKRESMKQARSINSCDDIDLHQQIKGNTNLGWCNSTGAGIVSDGYGNAAYPNDVGGYCPPKEGAPTISTSSATCPPPDADSLLGAEYADRLKGINYLCKQNNDGALSPQCMSAMHNIVCSPNGTLGRAFAGGGYASSSSEVKDPNEYLQQRGFTLSNAILNDGKDSFWNAFKNIWGVQQLANSGKNDKMTKAAANLCTGSAFNLCDLTDSDVRPFPLKCIREKAISMGYAQAGGLIAENSKSYWDTHRDLPRWGDVVANLKFWKNAADTPVDPKDKDAAKKASDQANAIWNVYGVSVKYPKQGCNYNGMFMYRYLATSGDTKYFDIYGSDFPFLGRYILKAGFPIKGTTFSEQTPSGQYVTEAQRMATMFRPSAGGKYNFYVMTSNFTRISINGKILAWANEQQGIKITETVDIVAGQTYLLVVDLMNPGGPWSLVVGASINGAASQLINPDQFFMPVNNRAPMFELAFNKMAIESTVKDAPTQDTQRIFKNLYRYNAPIGDLNGRRCMLVKSGPASGVFNYLDKVQGIRLRAMKSITVMIQIDSMNRASNSVTPTIFGFYNTQSSNPGQPPRSVNQTTDHPLYYKRVNDFGLSVNESAIFPYGIDPKKPMTQAFIDNLIAGTRAPVTFGTWMHIAFVWYDDFSGYGIYKDGVLKGTGLVPKYDPTLIMDQIRIGCAVQPDGCKWTGGIAWFRAFDYRLNEEAIKLDMADNWASID